jgi:uncharacterized protein
MNLEEKYENLKKIISSYESCAVAFSGGVDSSFLSKVCYDVLGEKAIAITVVSPMLPESELKDAMDVSSFVGIKHYFIKDDEIEDKVAENPVDRCYHCKKTEFGNVKEFAELKGVTTIFDGTNLDDLGDYRPGMQAVSELGVISPLKDAEFTKEDIREMSKILNLKTWNKPSFACLASRVPYGEKITENLQIVRHLLNRKCKTGKCQPEKSVKSSQSYAVAQNRNNSTDHYSNSLIGYDHQK